MGTACLPAFYPECPHADSVFSSPPSRGELQRPCWCECRADPFGDARTLVLPPLLHGPLPAFLPARVFRELSGLRRAGLCGTDPGSLRFLPAFADACRPGSCSAEPSGTPADAVHRFIYRCESPPHTILRLSATPFSPAGARHRCLSSLLSRPIRFRVGSPPPTARSGIVKNFLNFDCYSFHNSESFFTFVASKDVRFCDVRTLG